MKTGRRPAEMDARFDLKVPRAERVEWLLAAGRAGLPLTGWVRRCCREVLELELALLRESEAVRRDQPPSV